MNRTNRYKKIKKDYQAKSLKNPFFAVKRTGKKRSFRLWLPLLFLFLLGGILWFFLGSPFFEIKNLNIQGLTRSSQAELEEVISGREGRRRLLFFHESNFFLFDKDKLAQEILEKYNFASLEIIKVMPDTLELKISERPYAFIFQEGSELFYASSDGYIIKESQVTEEDKQKYFLLENKSLAVSLNSRNKLNLRQDYLDFVFALDNSLDEYPELIPERFIIDQELNTLIVKFKDGPSALFNVKNSPGEQVADLALVKKEKIKDNFSTVNYIDLRYGNRIFINE